MNSRAKLRAQRLWKEDPKFELEEFDSTQALNLPPAIVLPVGSSLSFKVSQTDNRLRLDRFLAQQEIFRQTALSRTRLQHLILSGSVSLEGQIVNLVNFKVVEGQLISVKVPEAITAEPEPQALKLDIVYEDDHLLVVNKPAGLVVHPAAGHADGTLVNALLHHCGESLSGIGGIKRPGIVHRLDKDTTGLLVVAKNDRAHQGLAALFADHGRTLPLLRSYRALAWGSLPLRRGTIATHLGRHPTHREKMAVVSEVRGRDAITHFEVTHTYGTEEKAAVSEVICELETGRTHQIRVHLAHLGHPLLGDTVYGPGFRTKGKLLSSKAQLALEKLNRQALHAQELGFFHPITGEELYFKSPLPQDLALLMKALSS